MSKEPNNIIQNSSESFYGGITGDNNIADDDDINIPGGNSLSSTTVKFFDAANNDFHLAPDSPGIDAGTSSPLYEEGIGGVLYDIDGDLRRTWDIGADEAAVEYVASVMESGGDYSSLSAWETGIQTDLTATSTAVFGTTGQTGTFVDDVTVTGQSSGATANLVHYSSSTGQVLLENISGTFEEGETISDGNGTTTLVDAGNPAIAVAKIDGAWDGPNGELAISGWETGKYNYIKIYTTDLAKHKGRWDENKYSISSSNSNITINVNHIKIDGLQFRLAGTSEWRRSIYVSVPDINEDITISNSIFEDVSGIDNRFAIDITYKTTVRDINILNNVIYNYYNGIFINGGTYDNYVFNNTVNNADGYGIYINYPNAYVKNNIAAGDGVDFGGNFRTASSSHNISSDATAPGDNSKTNTTVSFVDADNDDFHLALTDTAARNAGTSSPLYQEGVGGVFYDVDGTSRGGAWDIGADEAATEFVSTICESTSSGGACVAKDYSGLSRWEDAVECNLTASNTLVYSGTGSGSLSEDDQFTVYDDSGTATDITGYIVATTSSQILVDGLTGTAPFTLDTGYELRVTSENYFTVSGSGDQLGAPVIAVARIDGAWTATDTAAVTIDGWETGPGNYIKVYTTDSARHLGKWSYDRYRLYRNGGVAISLYEDNIKISGLQIHNYASSINWNMGIYADASPSFHLELSNNILAGQFSGTTEASNAIELAWSTNAEYRQAIIWNNIIYGYKNGAYNNIHGIAVASSWDNVLIYNNTVYNSYVCYDGQDSNVIAKNNIAQACDVAFDGIFSSDSDFNISSDSTAPGSNSKTNTTVTFVSTSTGDFHLSPSDTGAKNAGVNLSNDPNAYSLEPNALVNDIDGDSRSLTQPWDIGADEISDEAADTPARFSADNTDTDSLTDGLVGHWTFNEGLGSTVADRSGNGNDGTWSGSGSHWTGLGRSGNAGVFNGTDDYVITDTIDISTEFTISAWAYADDDVEWNSLPIIGTDTMGDSTGFSLAYRDFGDTDRFYVRAGYLTTADYASIPNNSCYQQWCHYTFSYQADGTHKAFVNGVLLKEFADTAGVSISNSFVLGGSINYLSGSLFDGNIDEIRIYNRALSQREIALLYNQGRAAVEWHFRNNLNDTGTLCEVNSSQCKNLTEIGNWKFEIGYLESGISAGVLDGSSYATLADDSYFDIASTADWALVATLKSADAGNTAVISKKTSVATSSAGWLLGMDMGYGDGVPVFMVSDGTNQFVLHGNTAINDNKWHTIAAIFDEDSVDNTKLYVDGTISNFARQGTISNIGPLANSIALNVGRLNDGTGLFTGIIDRIAFYPYALNRNDVLRENAGGFGMRTGNDPAQTETGQTYDPFGGAAPVAWWKLDEMSGNTAYDYASSSLNGTWQGTGTSTWHTNGKVGMGGKFNGSSDYIALPEILNNATQGTISAWITIPSTPSETQMIYAGGDSNNRLYFNIDSSGYIGAQFGSVAPRFTANTVISSNNWYYASLVWSGANGNLYINGILDGSGTASAGGNDNGECVGAYEDRNSLYHGSYFNGQIDDVKIYNYARTPAQIAWDYNRGKPVAHWKFDEASSGSADSASILDSSGYGYSGTGDDGANNTGLSWTTGKFGYALSFDGTDDYIDISQTVTDTPISFSLWAKPATNDVDMAAMYAGPEFENNGWAIQFNADGNIYATTNGAQSLTGIPYEAGQWYHVVAIFATSTSRQVYVNGEASEIGTASRVPSGTENTWIGADYSCGSPDYFQGQIDDVRIYNYALEDWQIKEIYNKANVSF